MSVLERNLPTISIVIPVYNSSIYLGRVVKGLISQTYDEFEVIVVNDGSTDNSLEVAENEFSQSGLNYKIINQSNRGVSIARNIGLDNAKGKYVCFIDSDDMISSEYLQQLVGCALTSSTPICFALVNRDINKPFELCTTKARIERSEDFLREFLYKGNHFSICSAIFERALFERYNVSFPDGYRYSEDVFVLWKLIARVKKIAVLDHVLYHYYQNPESAMHHSMDVRRMDAIELMKSLEQYMSEFSPEFSKEFKQYAVARHHWSILWQAALYYKHFGAFQKYISNFRMQHEMHKMRKYPGFKEAISSTLFCLSPVAYYLSVRTFSKFSKLGSYRKQS